MCVIHKVLDSNYKTTATEKERKRSGGGGRKEKKEERVPQKTDKRTD